VKEGYPTQGGVLLAFWTKVKTWIEDEKGASMVEYALLVVLIAIIALVAIRLAGNEVSQTFSDIASGLKNP
jgi:Flp pilus assembly pilin Flp